MFKTFLMQTKKPVRHPAVHILVGLLAGYTISSYFYLHDKEKILAEIDPIRETNMANSYDLIKPLLSYDLPEAKEFGEFTKLENHVQDYINKKESQGIQISMYFRDVAHGRWVGINENEKFTPASLFKVPLMIYYFKLAEKNPAILKRRFRFDKTSDANANAIVKSTVALKHGQSYAIAELIQHMIVDSDNNAMYLLYNNADSNSLAEIFSDLSMPLPRSNNSQDFISAKNYSLFFRVLYNATYLNREFSERALALLIKATFKDGIVAGVPKATLVAHKFGEYAIVEEGGGNIGHLQLHDCGIVYKNPDPYFLCVMTKGENIDILKKSIADISRIVYADSR